MNKLIPFRKGDLWGYANERRDVVIPVQYDVADLFDPYLRNNAIVCRGEKWGLINSLGQEVIPLSLPTRTAAQERAHEQIWGDREAIPSFEIDDDLARLDPRFVAECDYIGEFVPDWAPFAIKGKWGYVDKEGTIHIRPQYDRAFTGRADGTLLVQSQGKFGLIDRAGKIVVPFLYDRIFPFSEGLAAVSLDGKFGAVNESGKQVIDFLYDSLDQFREGLAPVAKGKRWGYLNPHGVDEIPFQFEQAFCFKNGRAAVVSAGHLFFIDRQGRREETGYEVLNINKESDTLHVQKDNKWGVVNLQGDLVVPLRYEPFNEFNEVYCDFSSGLMVMKREGLKGYVNQKGDEPVPPRYDFAWPFVDGLALVGVGKDGLNRFGFIDLRGNEVIALKYPLAHSFEDGIAFVENIGLRPGYIDQKGVEFFED